MPSTKRLTRRQTFGVLGVTGAGLLLGGGASGVAALDTADAVAAACTLTPEQELGPYYVALEKVRSTIVGGRPGVPLHLHIKVVNATTCQPLHAAAVDIWHCDATGVYSGEAVEGTSGATWLRGVQLTDTAGVARFVTIYPGFYEGRATHIHVRVHIGGSHNGSTYAGGHIAHTGQLFFSDAMSARVYRLAPYTTDHNTWTRHAADRVWTQEHGASGLVTLAHRGTSLARQGLVGTIVLGVDPSSTPSTVG
jgi:protocatechuate 3,4-dioxygenase beta subunit